MKYEVSVFYPDAEVTVKTNDPEIAILEILRADANGIHANVTDGYTGEVLALVNSPDGERYCTEEFSLMTLGFLFKMEQEAAEEEEAECVDCDLCPEDEECPSAEDMVLGLIQALGGLPN